VTDSNTISEEDIVRRGVIAGSLLASEDLKWFFSHLKQLTLETIGQTKPGELDRREQLFNQFRAVDDLLGIMQSYVDASKAIHTKNETDFD
jgi:hypothetical protein